ncbi:MAG: primosomal protein N' [Rickettsiaceae bacterium]
MLIIKVLLPKVLLFPLDYNTNKEYEIGDLVLVPFRNKEITGIVWQTHCTKSDKPLKQVIENTPFIGKVAYSLIELISKTSSYYLIPLGTVAKLVLPVDINELPIKTKEQDVNVNIKLPQLSPIQKDCLEQINNNPNKPILIKGVTGSGKTEIYFHAIINQLKSGKQALIMLPEIALSKQIITRFSQRFGFEPAIWNSTVTKAQKKRILRGIISGSVQVVIGARSALFLPYKNLGIIVVDEEHDPSYKQNEGILYNARDMAVLRGSIESCATLLVSATPSIESIYNTQLNKYHLIELGHRFNKAVLPKIRIIDMRYESLQQNNWLSEQAKKEIYNTVQNAQQVLIFLNRRGYAPLMLCKACGYKVHCPYCSASMVVHQALNRMECHHCSRTSPIHSICPECKETDSLILCGPGVERIAEEVTKTFPDCKVAIASKDQSSLDGQMQNLLVQMENSEIDILIGTQIITKGYHFPNLTLVIVVDADIGFSGGDLRTSERTFQLLHQVGGRAGREDKKGQVILQTYLPNHKVISSFVNNDEESFVKSELKARQNSGMPPFTKVAVMTVTGNDSTKTKKIAHELLSCAPKSSARILGPAEALMHKISGKYRYKLLIIVSRKFNLQKYLELWQKQIKIPSSYRLRIDIDPQNLL